MVDDADYETLNQFKWCAHNIYGRWYAQTRIDSKPIKMHRFLLQPAPGDSVDHVDCNGLNNQRANLRVCTQSENNRNSRKRRTKTSSSYKGVAFNKNAKKWQAYISVTGHRIHLGYFVKETDAALAYNRAATNYFSSFARLNVVKR